MKKENEKKSLLGRLLGGKKESNNCCCNFRIEEITEEPAGDKNPKDSTKPTDNCCKQ
ncbi:MAG: hypothetical protein GXY49_03600 [Syntrophomonadaceae bacterium]|nr:hypothetical protein [Syntrophomonadaceae bacterium]